ncbi:MAG: glycosyltransferase [Sphingomonadales bacterium]|jgi:glycosyltransferase involved in cell wall biosynthesis
MKKVLIIANLIHASPRIPGISGYFREQGWEAHIVTPQLGEHYEDHLGFSEDFKKTAIIETAPFKGDVLWIIRAILFKLGIKKDRSILGQFQNSLGSVGKKSLADILMRIFQIFFAYPDTERTWRKPALRKAKSLLQNDDFDLIISSSPFPTSHIIAAQLKKEFTIPWIADYRDTWTQNPETNFPLFRRFFETKLEKRTLKSADEIVTVSEKYAKDLKELHDRNIHVIPNGYTKLLKHQKIDKSKFIISYTGMIYPEFQDIERFAKAVRIVIENGIIPRDKIEIRFYGNQISLIEEVSKKYSLEGVIKAMGRVSRNKCYEVQASSQILLFFGWESEEKGGLSHLKFFEYISAQRPILISGGHQDAPLVKTGRDLKIGIGAFTKEELVNKLSDLYIQFKRNGQVPYKGIKSKIWQQSYEARSKAYLRLMRISDEET